MNLRRISQCLFAAAALGCALPAFATGSGFYWGLMLGPSNNTASNQQAQVSGTPTNPPTTVLVKPKQQQFGSRIFLGYMPSVYGGMEFGMTYFSSVKYTPSGNTTLCGSSNATVRDVEFLAKAAYPFKQQLSQFGVFGKAGAAFAYQNNGGALSPTSSSTCGQETHLSKWAPAFSVGVNYDITQNWVTELAMHRVNVGGKLGSMTMYGLGISYHFVDQYCGQFLC
ncbi:MAG: hypothetical protein A3F43_00705 [Gammaproteobacteria bacterium RIFCSPHIGHO2_12_FULL_42_10]|nr:MAG: hypothetical protein A3F43_00705 [Gammaproteobacteria bacterium RIFCSPHIGHO2_12_FULL_42_10]